MQINYFSYPEHKMLYKKMLLLTHSINDTYKGHTNWYNNVFLPGLKKKERAYIIALDKNGVLAGCVFLKNTIDEKKICTLFVSPDFRRQGIATALMEESIKRIGEHPLITVSSRNLDQLSPLLSKFGFHLSAVKNGVYNSEDTEFYFNDKKADLIKHSFIPVLKARIEKIRE